MLVIPVLLIIACLTVIITIPSTHATHENVNLVSIYLDNTCITMLKANMTGHYCPSYWDLTFQTGWDQSIKGSGTFAWQEDGLFFHRGSPEYKNVHRLYQYEEFRTLIDPPASIVERSKNIVIANKLPEYIPKGEYVKEGNHRVVGLDRYVDESCEYAIISGELWQLLIADTIYYMRNDCNDDYTNFSDTYLQEDKVSTMDRTTSYAYKYNEWLERAKEQCKEKC
jgi:hypothetical protein